MSHEKTPSVPSTVSAKWRKEGEVDPHDTRYDCERAELILGNYTDDELANAVYLYGDEKPDYAKILAGEAQMPIVYLQAAKDRIRWLSRKLEAELAKRVRYQSPVMQNWLTATETAVANIDQMLQLSDPTARDFVRLVNWLLATPANPDTFMPPSWGEAKVSAQSFEALMSCLHNCMVKGFSGWCFVDLKTFGGLLTFQDPCYLSGIEQDIRHVFKITSLLPQYEVHLDVERFIKNVEAGDFTKRFPGYC